MSSVPHSASGTTLSASTLANNLNLWDGLVNIAHLEMNVGATNATSLLLCAKEFLRERAAIRPSNVIVVFFAMEDYAQQLLQRIQHATLMKTVGPLGMESHALEVDV